MVEDFFVKIDTNTYVVIMIVVFSIGFSQVAISLVSFIHSFDQRRRKRLRTIAILIVIVFGLYTLINIDRFTDPTALPEIHAEMPSKLEDLEELSKNLISEDIGLWGMISIIIPIIVFLIGRRGDVEGIARTFLNVVSIGAFFVMAFVTLTNYVPSQAVTNIYITYQGGIMMGAILGSGILKYV